MISTRQLASSLYGVWLLLRWDIAGFGYFDRTFGGFWRSYVVAIALAPVYLAHAIASFSPTDGGPAFGAYLASEVIAYVMSWTVFPFAMMYIARLLERDAKYFDYMVAYNWFQLAVGAVLLPVLVLADVGVLVPESAAFLNLVILGAFFAYGIFLARHGLDVAPLSAVGVVFLDTLLSLMVRQVVAMAA